LKAIGGEPGLSNKEVGQRVGVASLAQIGELLRRLRQLGLIANTQPGRNPKANAWQLTSAGRGLVSADTPGVGAVDVGRPARSAGVSRESFDGSERSVLAAFEDGLERVVVQARVACEAEHGWLERVRVALLAVLEFFDEQPEVAMLLLVDREDGGPALRARRSEVLARLAQLLDGGRSATRAFPPPLTARAVLSGVLAELQGCLSDPGQGPLVELSPALMSFIVMPFLGAAAARRELERPMVVARAVAARRAARELLHNFSGRGMRHPLAPRVLHAIKAEPGLSNSEVATRAQVANEGHMSRVLSRLKRLGLIENTGATAHLPGRPNTWQLTSKGDEVEQALRYQISLTEEQQAFRRELQLTKKKTKTTGEVSATAACLQWVLPDTSGLLLRYFRRVVPRALPTSFVPLLRRSNKRWCLEYTILSRAASSSVHPRENGRHAFPAKRSKAFVGGHFSKLHSCSSSSPRSARCRGRSRRINAHVGHRGRVARVLQPRRSGNLRNVSRDVVVGLPRVHEHVHRSFASR
jgi:DNA-binding MarR family transcriptional regulator